MSGRPFYRILPGLDPYSDRFCRRLIRRLAARNPAGAFVSAFPGLLGATMLAGIWALGAWLASPAAYRIVAPSDRENPPGVWGWAAGMIGGTVGFVLSRRALTRAGTLAALRDALRPRIIDGWTCVLCGYSLAGLTGRDRRVICPECGRRVPIGVGAMTLIEQMIVRGELPDEPADEPSAGLEGAA